MDSSNGGRIVIVTRWPVFSVRIVATPFRTCGRPPRLNPVRLPEVPLCVGTFEAPNSVFAFLLIDAPQGVLAAVLGTSAEKAFALSLRRNGKLAAGFVPAVVLDEPAERSGGELGIVRERPALTS